MSTAEEFKAWDPRKFTSEELLAQIESALEVLKERGDLGAAASLADDTVWQEVVPYLAGVRKSRVPPASIYGWRDWWERAQEGRPAQPPQCVLLGGATDDPKVKPLNQDALMAQWRKDYEAKGAKA